MAEVVVDSMSSMASYRVRSTSLAVIWVGKTPAPRNPVAMSASGLSGSNSSPANCHCTNWS